MTGIATIRTTLFQQSIFVKRSDLIVIEFGIGKVFLIKRTQSAINTFGQIRGVALLRAFLQKSIARLYSSVVIVSVDIVKHDCKSSELFRSSVKFWNNSVTRFLHGACYRLINTGIATKPLGCLRTFVTETMIENVPRKITEYQFIFWMRPEWDRSPALHQPISYTIPTEHFLRYGHWIKMVFSQWSKNHYFEKLVVPYIIIIR